MMNDDRSYAFVDPLTRKIEQERYARKVKQLQQCKCSISKPFLRPVGQQLMFLSGKSRNGRGKRSKSMHIMVPLELLDPEQRQLYSKNTGVKW